MFLMRGLIPQCTLCNSNRMEVLQSVTETKRKSVKNIDLNNGVNFSTERALEVKWNITTISLVSQ